MVRERVALVVAGFCWLALGACGEATVQAPVAASRPTPSNSPSTQSEASAPQDARDCSTRCSGTRPDGTSWENRCGTAGCSTCVEAHCSEEECIAGCASIEGDSAQAPASTPAAGTTGATPPSGVASAKMLSSDKDNSGGGTTTCSCPQVVAERVIAACSASCTSPSQAVCNCNYWYGVGTWKVKSCSCKK